MFHDLKKYDKRSNPMRVLVCVACALIENASCQILFSYFMWIIWLLFRKPLFQGCSGMAIEKKADLVVPVGLDSSVSSAENSAHV